MTRSPSQSPRHARLELFARWPLSGTSTTTSSASGSPPASRVKPAHPPPSSHPSSASVSSIHPASRFRRRGHIAKLTGVVPRPAMPRPRPNADGKLVLACPLPDHICDFVQANWRRRVDMTRHLDAHFPAAPGRSAYRCVGCAAHRFPQEVFAALPKGLDVIRTVGGENYVGGCGKEFGRADSLRKHLQERRCVSDLSCAQFGGLWPDDDGDLSS
ncbi:hypothetical protein VTO73DRAFT_5663 [Trametes versicolor]